MIGRWTLLVAILLINLNSLEGSAPSLNKHVNDDIIVLTIPKSGTHLVEKLFSLLIGKKGHHLSGCMCKRNEPISPPMDRSRFHETVDRTFRKNEYLIAHFNYSKHVEEYLLSHPRGKVFLLIRDLRDVCVSAAFWLSKQIDRELGYSASMDEKLMWVITNGHDTKNRTMMDYELETALAVDWFDHPEVVLLRFEDLCGSKGGGTQIAQKESILAVSKALGVRLSRRDLQFLTTNLWGEAEGGASSTFRQGQIGSWREYFKEEHVAAFKERLGGALISLGYEENDDW